jgi:hypothetical protein
MNLKKLFEEKQENNNINFEWSDKILKKIKKYINNIEELEKIKLKNNILDDIFVNKISELKET